jgi:Flp pilus assembly protein TadD
VLSGLGVAYATEGDQRTAQRHLQEALKLSPGNPALLNNLAMSYMLDRKVEKAAELLRQAARTGQDSPEVARNLKLAMALKVSAEEAEARSVEVSPGSVTVVR